MKIAAQGSICAVSIVHVALCKVKRSVFLEGCPGSLNYISARWGSLPNLTGPWYFLIYPDRY